MAWKNRNGKLGFRVVLLKGFYLVRLDILFLRHLLHQKRSQVSRFILSKDLLLSWVDKAVKQDLWVLKAVLRWKFEQILDQWKDSAMLPILLLWLPFLFVNRLLDGGFGRLATCCINKLLDLRWSNTVRLLKAQTKLAGRDDLNLWWIQTISRWLGFARSWTSAFATWTHCYSFKTFSSSQYSL